MKSTIGHIPIPLHEVKIVHDEIQIIDVLLDMDVPKMSEGLKMMYDTDLPQVLAVAKPSLNLYCVICRPPLDNWKSFESQESILFMGPGILKLMEYFAQMQSDSEDQYERDAIYQVLAYLRELYQRTKEYKQKKQQYYQSGSSSSSTG